MCSERLEYRVSPIHKSQCRTLVVDSIDNRQDGTREELIDQRWPHLRMASTAEHYQEPTTGPYIIDELTAQLTSWHWSVVQDHECCSAQFVSRELTRLYRLDLEGEVATDAQCEREKLPSRCTSIR